MFRVKQTAVDRWLSLVAEVDQVIRTMPLWKLQTVGEERLDFLYENLDRGTRITLKPGVAYCFRTFYELLRDLIEGAWLRFVQRHNANNLGSVTDLGAFLFGKERASLDAYRDILFDVQRGTCLYCRKPLPKQTHVDHFIPWSRYPADLGHNFVLAHERCNGDKSDSVAAENHLSSWVERNHSHERQLNERFTEAALPFEMASTIQIAKWVYGQTEKAHGQVWVEKRILKPLGRDWIQSFVA